MSGEAEFYAVFSDHKLTDFCFELKQDDTVLIKNAIEDIGTTTIDLPFEAVILLPKLGRRITFTIGMRQPVTTALQTNESPTLLPTANAQSVTTHKKPSQMRSPRNNGAPHLSLTAFTVLHTNTLTCTEIVTIVGLTTSALCGNTMFCTPRSGKMTKKKTKLGYIQNGEGYSDLTIDGKRYFQYDEYISDDIEDAQKILSMLQPLADMFSQFTLQPDGSYIAFGVEIDFENPPYWNSESEIKVVFDDGNVISILLTSEDETLSVTDIGATVITVPQLPLHEHNYVSLTESRPSDHRIVCEG